MASGIALSTQCAEAYKALDTRACSLIVLKINEEMTEVSVEKKLPPSLGDPEGEWRAFVKELPDSDCRYVVPDFSWKETPTVTKSKICMILWSPDGASIKSKMIYASSKEAVLAQMKVQKNMQATERDELDYLTVKDGLRGK